MTQCRHCDFFAPLRSSERQRLCSGRRRVNELRSDRTMMKHLLLVPAFCILGAILGATGGHAEDMGEPGEGGVSEEEACAGLLDAYLNGESGYRTGSGGSAPCTESTYGYIMEYECSSDIKQQAQKARSLCLGQRATEPLKEPTIATPTVRVLEPTIAAPTVSAPTVRVPEPTIAAPTVRAPTVRMPEPKIPTLPEVVQ
jgi:hypothetical protein